MPIRFYLLPVDEPQRADGGQYQVPKYVTVPRDPRGDQLLAGVPYEYILFGLEPTMLIALDVTAAQHTTLTANSDVTTVPVNIDNTLGANLATVQAALEALHIPADALAAGTTYRQVLRGIIGIFRVAQRFHNQANTQIFPAGITLSTPLSDLSQAVRTKLQQAATDLGYDYSGLTLASTLRDVLKALANQAAPATVLGVAI
jgi:hypothetical protein